MGDIEACSRRGRPHHKGPSCAEPPDARIGTTVEKYRIVRLLGRGGMGSVYEAEHTMLGRRFAIKFMLPEYATDQAALRRFENEARAAGSLEHPNIAAVVDYGRAQDSLPYLVIEYLVGQDCAKMLAHLGPLPCATIVQILLPGQLASFAAVAGAPTPTIFAPPTATAESRTSATRCAVSVAPGLLGETGLSHVSTTFLRVIWSISNRERPFTHRGKVETNLLAEPRLGAESPGFC